MNNVIGISSLLLGTSITSLHILHVAHNTHLLLLFYRTELNLVREVICLVEKRVNCWPLDLSYGLQKPLKPPSMKVMEIVLLNATYGFTTINTIPKAKPMINKSKTKANHIVGLTKEHDVAQAEADGTVKESALANEMKAQGVQIAILLAINQVHSCYLVCMHA